MKDVYVRIVLFILFFIYIYYQKRSCFAYHLYFTITKTLSLIFLLTFNIKSAISRFYQNKHRLISDLTSDIFNKQISSE